MEIRVPTRPRQACSASDGINIMEKGSRDQIRGAPERLEPLIDERAR